MPGELMDHGEAAELVQVLERALELARDMAGRASTDPPLDDSGQDDDVTQASPAPPPQTQTRDTTGDHSGLTAADLRQLMRNRHG